MDKQPFRVAVRGRDHGAALLPLLRSCSSAVAYTDDLAGDGTGALLASV